MSGLLGLSLLGTFQATVNQEPVTGFAYDKVRALLAYLAVESDYPHRRDALTGLFWPEQADTAARLSLNQAIYTLRKTLGDKKGNEVPFILADRTSIQLNPAAAVWLDAREFEKQVTVAFARTANSKLQTVDVQQLQQAISLYRGDFLRGLCLDDSPAFDDWLALTRERLHRLALEALDYLAQYETRRGEWEQALTYARGQVELEPWREEAHRQIMLLLARTGDYNGALTQYDTCQAVLAEELAMEPMPETTRLYRRIVAVRGGDHPHNLPPQTTELIGREADLQHLKQLFAHPDKRLITLVGPGGIGKTRLAIEAARQNQNLFLEGVAFVPLVALSEPGQMIPTIASSVNFPLRSEARRTPAQQLLDYLRRKEMLLVLDNFEHLLDGVALLSDILATAPDVKLLVTSRQQLQLQAEQLFSVTGLDYPKWATQTVSEASLMEAMVQGEAVTYPAGQLLLKAAQRRQPDFALMGSDEQHSVADICRLVGGMPLALELAAAWVDTLSLTDIAAEIQQSLDFLESERRDIPERHHSIRAAFDASWNLLSDREQAVFAQLSAFRGGFTREAARAVTGTSLRQLSRLISQSLLQFDRQNDRYHIHELLRQYGREKLRKDPAVWQETKMRFVDYYAHFLLQIKEHLHGAAQMTALDTILAESSNIPTAWQWAVEQRRFADLVNHMLSSLFLFAKYSAELDLFLSLVESAYHADVTSDDDVNSRARQATWFSLLIELPSHETVHPDMFRRIQHIWEIAKDPGVEREMGFWFLVLAEGYIRFSDRAEGTDRLRRAVSRLRMQDESLTLAYGLGALGRELLEQDLALRKEAEPYLAEALAIYERLGDQYGQGYALRMLGKLSAENFAYEEAVRYWEAAYNIAEAVGNWLQICHVAADWADGCLQMGAFDKAFSLLQSAHQTASQKGYILSEVHYLGLESVEAARYGSLATAKELRRQAITLAESAKFFLPWNAWGMGELLRLEGKLVEAGRYFAYAYQQFEQVADELGLAYVYWGRGDIALTTGNLGEAEVQFGQSLALLRRKQHKWTISYVLSRLGITAVHQNNLRAAKEHLNKAIQLAYSIGNRSLCMVALTGWAHLAAAERDMKRATMLSAFVQNFPVCWHETRAQATALLEVTSAQLTTTQKQKALSEAESQTFAQFLEGYLKDFHEVLC